MFLMADPNPVTRAERAAWAGYHDLGMSIRDIRDITETERGRDTIRWHLKDMGREPHPSKRGPSPDGPSDTCPKCGGPKMVDRYECPVCKKAQAKVRKDQRRADFARVLDEIDAVAGTLSEPDRAALEARTNWCREKVTPL